MRGGLCKIHGTPLNGFGTYTFCNECDAENEAQNTYEADRDKALATTSGTTNANVGLSGCVDTDDYYGYVIMGHQQPCRQKGFITIPANKALYEEEPEHSSGLGAIYRFRMKAVSRFQTSRHSYRAKHETQVYAEQVLYMRDGRKYIGEVDVGPWDCPDP